jgi:hypothetical protein
MAMAVLSAALLGGCTVSLGASGSRAWSAPLSQHAGVTVQGILALPRDYRWVVGLETSTSVQTSPDLQADQWRGGALFGYASLPQPYERWGWEVLGRAQFMRGSEGTFNRYGGVLGASAAFPMRLSASRDPWEVDELLGVRTYLAPSIGINAVAGSNQSVHPEVTLGLFFRVAITSTLLP